VTSEPYTGPIIDSHHHFWDMSMGKHPWLNHGDKHDGLDPLRKAFLPADYAALASKANIVATVHIEANWDPSDPVGETRWLDSLQMPIGIASRYVAYAPLMDSQFAKVLDQQARYERVVGIRDILSWHPDPRKSRVSDQDRMTNPNWRRNLGRLSSYNFVFELLVSPWQLVSVRQLADDFPGVTFILNHCGSPMDRDAEGMRRWSDGLSILAGAPNVSIKISNPVAYDQNWTFNSLSKIILTCIEKFGPGRTLFASDHPVAGLHIRFSDWLSVFTKITRNFSDQDKSAMFYENARCLYRIHSHS